ncbi:hypothetical protein ACFL3Q_05545 [Planctomycetota bacterium]
MNKPNKRLCLISGVSFFAGAWVGIVALIVLFSLSQWSYGQRKQKIESFFYRTMHSIFEGTYDSDDGSVYPDALETIKEYEPRLGKKCKLFFTDSSGNSSEWVAFFPSGDYFYVYIGGKYKKLVIYRFDLLNWEESWSSTLYRIGERSGN